VTATRDAPPRTAARDTGRPTTVDCPVGAFTGFARVGGRPVTVLGHQKGHYFMEINTRRQVLADAEFRKATHSTALVDRIQATTKEVGT
jgi:acetyl-CoA carboxylase alpha subunit